MSRISLFSKPVICLHISNDILYEAVKYSEENVSEDKNYLKNREIAKYVSYVAFCKYYNLPSNLSSLGFIKHNNGLILINSNNVGSWELNLKSTTTVNIYKKPSDNDVYYVVTYFTVPSLFIVGYAKSEDLKNGKNQILLTDLNPMKTFFLDKYDSRKLYI